MNVKALSAFVGVYDIPRATIGRPDSRGRARNDLASFEFFWRKLTRSGEMIPKNWLLASRRPCPACGGTMQYKPTLLTWLTQRYRRVCTICSYVDSTEVKL
jgi:hypothetical protein